MKLAKVSSDFITGIGLVISDLPDQNLTLSAKIDKAAMLCATCRLYFQCGYKIAKVAQQHYQILASVLLITDTKHEVGIEDLC